LTKNVNYKKSRAILLAKKPLHSFLLHPPNSFYYPKHSHIPMILPAKIFLINHMAAYLCTSNNIINYHQLSSIIPIIYVLLKLENKMFEKRYDNRMNIVFKPSVPVPG
jgi:hypothetical protein